MVLVMQGSGFRVVTAPPHQKQLVEGFGASAQGAYQTPPRGGCFGQGGGLWADPVITVDSSSCGQFGNVWVFP